MNPPTTRNAIVAALREHGPMTATELAETLAMTRSAIANAVQKARAHGNRTYLYITAWRRPIGHGGAVAPVYDVGPGEDVRRPTIGPKARKLYDQRYERSHRAERRIASALRRGSTVNPFKQLVRIWRDQRQEQQ